MIMSPQSKYWGDVSPVSHMDRRPCNHRPRLPLRPFYRSAPLLSRADCNDVVMTMMMMMMMVMRLLGSQIFWLRNGERLDVASDTNFIISNDGNLIVSQARLSDAGNYSCGALNIAGRRLSDPARLSVYGTLLTYLLSRSFVCLF